MKGTWLLEDQDRNAGIILKWVLNEIGKELVYVIRAADVRGLWMVLVVVRVAWHTGNLVTS
jgi:hypothetical protein